MLLNSIECHQTYSVAMTPTPNRPLHSIDTESAPKAFNGVSKLTQVNE